MKWLFLLLPAALCAGENVAANYSAALHNAGLDAEECYRVHDISVARDELRLYLNSGFLIFAKPVDGKRTYAVFVTDAEGGDAEVLVTPPSRSERLSLSQFAATPNLSERITHALLVFTDNAEQELRSQIETRAAPKAREMGLILADKWSPVARNFISSFEIRLVQDRFSADASRRGFFYCAVTGRTLGNFDVLFDPRAREQIVVGQVVYRDNRRYFDIWTSFASRSFRTGKRVQQTSDLRVSRVRIEARIAQDLSMTAVTRMQWTAGQSADPVLAFELSRRMRITGVLLDGAPAEFFLRDSMRSNLIRGGENDAFLIVLPAPPAPGSTHELEFQHEGNVVVQSGNGVYYVNARDSWYPNHGGQFAFFDLQFTYPRALELVATGDSSEERTEGESKTSRWTTSAPVRFAGFNLGKYEKASLERAGLRVDVYANRSIESALQPRPQTVIVQPVGPPRGIRRPPDLLPVAPMAPDPTARLHALAAEISGALGVMSGWFGPPALKHLTVSPIPGAFGQGFPGLLYLSTLTYLHPSERPAHVRTQMQQTFFSEMLQAHEVAHQWWGNLVASASYQDDWLMEALANYSALMHLEKRKGRKALDEILESYREHLLAKTPDGNTVESAGPIVWGLRLNSSQTAGSWRVITYEKGSWILHMLRARLGDAAFLKMLNNLAANFRYKRINTGEFQAFAAQYLAPGVPDPKLDAFFEQWVYSTGIPSLRLDYKIEGRAPKFRVRGSLTQSGAPPDFSVLAPVTVQLPNRRLMTKWVQTSSEPVSFSIELPAAPSRVLLDPGNTMLLLRGDAKPTATPPA